MVGLACLLHAPRFMHIRDGRIIRTVSNLNGDFCLQSRFIIAWKCRSRFERLKMGHRNPSKFRRINQLL